MVVNHPLTLDGLPPQLRAALTSRATHHRDGALRLLHALSSFQRTGPAVTALAAPACQACPRMRAASQPRAHAASYADPHVNRRVRPLQGNLARLLSSASFVKLPRSVTSSVPRLGEFRTRAGRPRGGEPRALSTCELCVQQANLPILRLPLSAVNPKSQGCCSD